MEIIKFIKEKSKENLLLSVHIILFTIFLILILFKLEFIKTPFLLNVFLYTMGIQIYITFAILLEDLRITMSDVWKYAIVGNIFCIFITFMHGTLLYNFLKIHDNIVFILSLIFTIFYIMTHFMANVGAYDVSYIVTKKRISIFRRDHILGYIVALLGMECLRRVIPTINFPPFMNYEVIYYYLIISSIVFLSFAYSLLKIAIKHKTSGFLYKPYLVAMLGSLSVIFASLFAVIIFNLSGLQSNLFYPLFFYISAYVLSVAFWEKFAIEYPSLINIKIKRIMPVDIVNFSKILVLSFFAFVLLIEFKDYIKTNKYIIAILLILMASIIYELISHFYEKTSLKYWNYLKIGLISHITATLVIVTFFEYHLKYILIILLSFIFYIIYILDLKELSKNINIIPKFKEDNLIIVFLSLFVFWMLLDYMLPGIIPSPIETKFINTFIVLSIVIFIVTFPLFIANLRKGFGKIFEPTKYSVVEYVISPIVFILVALIYMETRKPQLFLFFLFYLISFIFEILSVRSLSIEKKVEEKPYTIDALLREHLTYWIRTDIIEELTNKIKEKYGLDIKVSIKNRNIEIFGDESDKIIFSTALLLEMYKQKDLKTKTIYDKPFESIKKDIENILKERILILPEDLRSYFEYKKYYVSLFEKSVVELLKKLSAFIPEEDILRVKRKIIEEMKPEMDRETFIRRFKIFLALCKEVFPLSGELFSEIVMDYISTSMKKYGFKINELIDTVPLGIAEYDEKYGGVPRCSNIILVCEDENVEKDIIMKYMNEGLKEDDIIIYITAKLRCEDIIDYVKIKKPKKTIKVLYVDEKAKTEEIDKECIKIPMNLIILQKNIVSTIKSFNIIEHKRVIVDIYPVFIKNFSWSDLKAYIMKQLSGFKKWNCTTLLILSKEFLNRYGKDIKEHVDIIIEVKKIKNENIIEVFSPSRGFRRVVSI